MLHKMWCYFCISLVHLHAYRLLKALPDAQTEKQEDYFCTTSWLWPSGLLPPGCGATGRH